jgi:hypothetical protein
MNSENPKSRTLELNLLKAGLKTFSEAAFKDLKATNDAEKAEAQVDMFGDPVESKPNNSDSHQPSTPFNVLKFIIKNVVVLLACAAITMGIFTIVFNLLKFKLLILLGGILLS